MTEKRKTIQIGSVIHLENGATDGGFLETRGRVQDKPVITKWQDARIRTFVMTHESRNRDTGSGSWRVLSAAGKAIGEPLAVGDRIHLLNMYPGAGYLDSFEWVSNLEPFKDYPMTIGVFTANTPTRGGGLSGTWVVCSAEGRKPGEPVQEGDAIYLENDYPGAGFLHTYAKEKVTDHPLFPEYDGELKFVFTAATPAPTNGSRLWTVHLRELQENSYRVWQQWNDKSAPWHDGGIFQFNGRQAKPVAALKLDSPDNGKTLTGRVTFAGETPLDFTARRLSQNRYTVSFTRKDAANPPPADHEWLIGARQSQNVVALKAKSDDGGQTLHGKIRYQEEGPIRFRAVRESKDARSRPADAAQTNALLKGRSGKIEGVMETTYQLLAGAFAQISGASLNKAAQKIKRDEENALSAILSKSEKKSEQDDDVDRAFQLTQLLNLYTLSESLNAFFRETLQPLIRQTMETSRRNGDRLPLHLIRRSYRQAAADHEIIQQAAAQRQWNKHLDGRYYISEQATELLIMDKLAFKAIAPFRHLLSADPEQLAVITYLSERTHIRHAPYAPRFVLIGLSYDRVPSADSLFEDTAVASSGFPSAELMAIPHETGHHIYQHGRLPDGKTFPQISEKFRDNPYYAWHEEIFADLYGCIVAGPLSALGMQALLVSLDRRRFWKDDEDHPTPLLRVFIMAEMLRLLGDIDAGKQAGGRYNFNKIADRLDADWANILTRWGYDRLDEGNGRPRRVYLPDPAASQLDKVVNVERVIQAVRPIIIEFAKLLLNEAGFDQPASDNTLSLNIPWSADSSGIAPYTEKMRSLRTRHFANKKLAIQWLKAGKGETAVTHPDDTAHPEKQLRRILEKWSDSGPTGHGDHPD